MPCFHFDLRHRADADELLVRVPGQYYGLKRHADDTRRAARANNKALAVVPEESLRALTHYADLHEGHFAEEEALHWVWVVRPAPPGVHLDEVVLMTSVLSKAHLRAVHRRRLETYVQPLDRLNLRYGRRLKAHPGGRTGKLAAMGLAELPPERDTALELLVDAQLTVTASDTAAALVSFHPDLANVQPPVHGRILHEHIFPDPDIDPEQYNAISALTKVISDPSVQPWSATVPCQDAEGNLLCAEYDLLDDQGKGFKAGQQLYTHSLAASVRAAAAPCIAGARRTTSDDQLLRGQNWFASPGTTALTQDGDSVSGPVARASAGLATATGGYKWAIEDKTWHFGIYVDEGSIQLTDKGDFSIDAKNLFLRTLYAGYELFDQSGKNIPVPSPTPEEGPALLESISAVNAIMGIPVPTDPTTLSLPLKDASTVQLWFGSLGTRDWDGQLAVRGTLLTLLWQYGVPTIFLIAGAKLKETTIFNKLANDPQIVGKVLSIVGRLVLPVLGIAAVLHKIKQLLAAAGSFALSVLVSKGLEAVSKWIVAQVGTEAIVNAFGPAGWVNQLASAVLDGEQIALTTLEWLASPADFKIKVSRTIDVTLTLLPDPRHGEVGHPETAVWPAIAVKYAVLLQYKDGTGRELTGNLPTTTSGAPLSLTFWDVPAGGKIRVIAGLYSANGWLAGSWQSDWMDARGDANAVLALGSHSITEKLVPLAPDSQYVYKEKIAFQDGSYKWHSGDIPSDTLAVLDPGNTGTLAELVGLTLNNSAFQIGYVWRASGLNLPEDDPSSRKTNDQLYVLQNLSVLADPGSRLKTTSFGFKDRLAIGYAPSPNATRIDQTNFVVDPRRGGNHLRQITLDDGNTDFGLGATDLKSWGYFPVSNVDAIAIHPSNAVVACSYRDSRLLIAQLPEAPTSDGKAQASVLASGEGIRQGLMRGPRALAIAPDGRILVLEADGKRVQAFDTKGNAVPSFTPAPAMTSLPSSQIAAALDTGKIPEALPAALQAAGVGFQFTLDASLTTQLDKGQILTKNDPIVEAFAFQCVVLPNNPDLMSKIKVIESGKTWDIVDPRGPEYRVVLDGSALDVYVRLKSATVRVQKPGERWLLLDTLGGVAWQLIPSSGKPGTTEVLFCQSFFPLRPPRAGAVTYLDMAVEAQGYIYVLSYMNNGKDPTDYLLDIYNPDGRFLMRTPDPSVTKTPQNVVAAKIAVDIWRDLFALTYERLPGAPGGPQPGLAHWVPTPPLFNFPLTAQPDFNDRNIGAVVQDFSSHGITLSNQAFIIVNDPDGAWSVQDGTTIYHVYRNSDGLQVYLVPA